MFHSSAEMRGGVLLTPSICEMKCFQQHATWKHRKEQMCRYDFYWLTSAIGVDFVWFSKNIHPEVQSDVKKLRMLHAVVAALIFHNITDVLEHNHAFFCLNSTPPQLMSINYSFFPTDLNYQIWRKRQREAVIREWNVCKVWRQLRGGKKQWEHRERKHSWPYVCSSVSGQSVLLASSTHTITSSFTGLPGRPSAPACEPLPAAAEAATLLLCLVRSPRHLISQHQYTLIHECWTQI